MMWRIILAVAVIGGAAAAARGQSHGFDLAIQCQDAAIGEPAECQLTLTHNDAFGDTTTVTEAWTVFDPGGFAVRVPAVGNLPVLTLLGNARFAGMTGTLPVVLGAAGSTLNGLPGDPQPGFVVLVEDTYVVSRSDPTPITVQGNAIANDNCDDPATSGCIVFPSLLQVAAAVEIVEADCNDNGVPDFEEIDADPDLDCDGDGVLDECEPDSNGDGIIDDCDCNDNGQLDDVDVAGGDPAVDYNLDGVPDACVDAFEGDADWSAANGLFRDQANWNPDTPREENAAIFDGFGPLTITFDADAEIDRLLVPDGAVAFDLAGHEMRLGSTNDSTVIVAAQNNDVADLSLTGGTLIGGAGRIGSGAGSDGVVRITGPDTIFAFAENLCVGCAGAGLLEIDDGALVVSRDAAIGDQAQSFGEVVLMDADPNDEFRSEWIVPFFLTVDNGRLEVGEDTVVTAGFDAFGGIFLFGDGRLEGSGRVDARVINFGDFAPGGPESPMTIDGGYVQVGTLPDLGAASGSLEVEIGAPGMDAPLVILGDASLGGGLFVSITPGADPQPGAIFSVLEATTRTGHFDVAFFPGLSDRVLGLAYDQPLASGGLPGVSITVQSLTDLLNFDGPASATITGTPTDVAVGQFDADAAIDLAIAIPGETPTDTGTVVVLFNVVPNGTTLEIGAQTTIDAGVGPTAIAAGQLDADGLEDLVVTNGGSNNAFVLINNGGTNFSTTIVDVGVMPQDVAIADFTGDEIADIVVANAGDDTITQLTGGGDGTFPETKTIAVPGTPYSIDPETVDDDKDIDAAIALLDGGAVAIVLNDGGGLAAPLPGTDLLTVPVGAEPVQVLMVDLDGNKVGDVFPADIVTINRIDGTVSVARNNGDLTFQAAVDLPAGIEPRSLAAVDLDQDGDLDLAVANGGGMSSIVQVLRNDTTLVVDRDPSPEIGPQLILTTAEAFAFGDGPVLVTTGDLDGDSDEDLITINDLAGNPVGFGPGQPMASVKAFPNLLVTCFGDSNNDGVVNVIDLNNVIIDWGTDGSANSGDLTGPGAASPPDGIVNVNDLNLVISHWGVCP